MTDEELSRKIDLLEKKFGRSVKRVLMALRRLMEPENHKPTLGFARKKIS